MDNPIPEEIFVELQENPSKNLIQDLYKDPLVSRIGDDLRTLEPLSHPLISYLGVFLSGVFVGAFVLIKFSPYEIEVHNILTRRAIPALRQISKMVVDYIFNTYPIQRITGWIQEDIKTAINHVIKSGFLIEGCKQDALLVRGELKNLILVGLTRDRWRSLQ